LTEATIRLLTISRHGTGKGSKIFDLFSKGTQIDPLIVPAWR
jgi:hypothetical protein